MRDPRSSSDTLPSILAPFLPPFSGMFLWAGEASAVMMNSHFNSTDFDLLSCKVPGQLQLKPEIF